jgi:hypothetical protein
MREPKAKLSTKFSLYTISARPSRYTPVNNVNMFTQEQSTILTNRSCRFGLFLIVFALFVFFGHLVGYETLAGGAGFVVIIIDEEHYCGPQNPSVQRWPEARDMV